jgi:hypothetical protein
VAPVHAAHHRRGRHDEGPVRHQAHRARGRQRHLLPEAGLRLRDLPRAAGRGHLRLPRGHPRRHRGRVDPGSPETDPERSRADHRGRHRVGEG